MLRYAQGIEKNINGMYKAKEDMKRGMLVIPSHKDKNFSKATSETGEGCFFVDRGLIANAQLDTFGVLSDYEEVLEVIKAGEIAELHAPMVGERYMIDTFKGTDTDFEADKYLSVQDGEMVKSSNPTRFKSYGFVNDNGHKLLGVEIVK